MFGNRLGWIISLILIVFVIAGLREFYVAATAASPPTAVGLNASTYSMQLPIDPRSVAIFMTDPVDAVDLYKQAIREYESHERAFDSFAAQGKLNSPELTEIQPVLNFLLKARTAKNPGVFKDRPAELITYDNERPTLKNLKSLGEVAQRVGMLHRAAGNHEKAQQYFEAVFALGTKLCEERIVYDEWDAGRNLLAVAHYLIESARELHQSAMADQFQQFEQQFLPFYKQQIEPIQQTIFITKPYTGDILALAQNAGDPMWRVEAILALGRCRFSGETRGDQVAANHVVRALANSNDPLIRLAVTQARDLTVEEFRKLH